MSIQSNCDVVQDMRKNGNRFKVDIVEGSGFWFSTIHESMTQAENKNFNYKTLHTLSTNYHVGHMLIYSEKPKSTTV